MPRINCTIILSAIVAAAVAPAPGIARATANTPRDSGSARTLSSDRVAAERASASESAPLDPLSLTGVHPLADQGGCGQDKFRSGGAPVQPCRDRCRRVGLPSLARRGGRSSSAATPTCATHGGKRHRKAGCKSVRSYRVESRGPLVDHTRAPPLGHTRRTTYTTPDIRTAPTSQQVWPACKRPANSQLTATPTPAV